MNTEDVPHFLLQKALEFNASVIAYCTPFVGNCTDEKTIKSFVRGYKDISDHYQKVVRKIVDDAGMLLEKVDADANK